MNSLLYPIVIPFITGLLCLLPIKRIKGLREGLAIGGSLVTFVITLLIFIQKPCSGTDFFILDNLAGFILLFIGLFGVIIAVYSIGFMEKHARIKKLKGDLLHYSYHSTDEHMDKINRYTDIYSEAFVRQSHRAGYFHLVFHPIWKFLRNYILRLGFLDGTYGLTISVIQSYETFLKYSKIIELLKKKKRLSDTSGFTGSDIPEMLIPQESYTRH